MKQLIGFVKENGLQHYVIGRSKGETRVRLFFPTPFRNNLKIAEIDVESAPSHFLDHQGESSLRIARLLAEELKRLRAPLTIAIGGFSFGDNEPGPRYVHLVSGEEAGHKFLADFTKELKKAGIKRELNQKSSETTAWVQSIIPRLLE